MNHINGWAITVTSIIEINPHEIKSVDDTWVVPDVLLLDILGNIISLYHDNLVSIKLEPDYEGIPV